MNIKIALQNGNDIVEIDDEKIKNEKYYRKILKIVWYITSKN